MSIVETVMRAANEIGQNPECKCFNFENVFRKSSSGWLIVDDREEVKQ